MLFSVVIRFGIATQEGHQSKVSDVKLLTIIFEPKREEARSFMTSTFGCYLDYKIKEDEINGAW